MSVVASDVLRELETRAGASDVDRELWLAERRTGVTATEISKLFLATGGARLRLARELIDLKLGVREDSFAGNIYTAWGKEREPVIAEAVRERSAIAPESRVFHAADNPRFLASPDGVGVSFDDELRVSEIKTSLKDRRVGSEGFAEAGYLYQMMWSMRVTGARRCLYVTEERLPDVEGGFLAGAQSFEWVEWDAALATELEELAVWFLAELDAARTGVVEALAVDEVLDTLAVNLLRFREAESEGKRAKEAAWKQLLELLAARGSDFSQESTLARITYSAVSESIEAGFDQEAAVDSSEAARKRWESLLKARAALAVKEAAWVKFREGFPVQVQRMVGAKLTVTAVKVKEQSK